MKNPKKIGTWVMGIAILIFLFGIFYVNGLVLGGLTTMFGIIPISIILFVIGLSLFFLGIGKEKISNNKSL